MDGEVCNIVQEVIIKTIPKKNKCDLKKGLPEEAEKIREVKGKGEKERYAQWNAEFWRIARKDKKVLISEHCKS